MKIGIALDNLGPSQLNYYLVKNGNEAVLNKPTLDITAFVNTSAVISLPANFAAMPMYEAWGYNGVLIATTFITAQKAQKCLAPQKKFFYVWDLEWLRPSIQKVDFNYRVGASVYCDPLMPLIARSAEHARVLEECWNI
jgi:hypothetical protein